MKAELDGWRGSPTPGVSSRRVGLETAMEALCRRTRLRVHAVRPWRNLKYTTRLCMVSGLFGRQTILFI